MNKTSQDELISRIYQKSVFTDQSKLTEITSGLNSKKLKVVSENPGFKKIRNNK